MRIIRIGDEWGDIPIEHWLEAMTPPSKGLCDVIGTEFRVLVGILESYGPASTTVSHREMPVVLPPGKAVGTHFHKQWTLIYYIDAEDVPIIVDGIAIYPADNTALLLEPDTPHEVARNETLRPRISLALRFKPCE